MSESLVTPERYLAYLREQGVSADALTVAPTALVGWGGLHRALVKATSGRRRRNWPYDSEWPYHDADGLGVVRLPTGAPATAFLLDQLVACGARLLVTVGIGGSLVPSVPPGTVVVVGDAIAGDGTSPRYAPCDDRTIPASPTLAKTLVDALRSSGADAITATAWTTDAPFRETPAAVEAARSAGAVAVDMETAAVYALAAYRRVAACSILVITDGVWDNWQPAIDTQAVLHAFGIVSRTLPTAVTVAS